MKTEFKFRKAGARVFVSSVAIALLGLGCSDDDIDTAPTIKNYAATVYAGYSDALAKAQLLKAAVGAFVAAPTVASLEAARTRWLEAREPYGLTEAFRFYDGPIDNPDTGPEPRINSWPLDEAFVDYVEGNPTSGIINDLVAFPTLTKEMIAAQNEKGGEKNIATGYHAIEFLLWGQDHSATGPGDRPHTDYVVGALGTAMNQDRRGLYLKLVTEQLVDDLGEIPDQWAPGGTNYGSEMIAGDSREALRRILQGMGSLSGAELSGERMTTAIDNRDQEDEHSCFSDNTHRDLLANATAIQNVYLGRLGAIDGPGLDELVRGRDKALDAKLQQQLAASVDAIAAIPTPFDQAIISTEGRALAMAAVRALQAETETIVEVATLLGVQINLE